MTEPVETAQRNPSTSSGPANADQTGPNQANPSRLLAIGLMCGAFAAFAALDTSAKWLTPRIGVIETTWVRYALSFVFVVITLAPWRRPQILRSKRLGLQITRSLLLFAATILNFVALQYLQLAETTTIMFTQPLIVALVSGPLLGEWVGPRRLIAIGIGFLGVLLITRPGAGGIHWAAGFSVVGVLCYAAYAMMTRTLAGVDSSETTMLFSAAAGVVILTPVVPFIWHAKPDGMTILIMLALGFWASLGHWLLILAHRHASAAVLAPYLYSEIIWMIGLGYWVFGDIPDRWTLAGAGIVILAGLYLFHRERLRGGKGNL